MDYIVDNYCSNNHKLDHIVDNYLGNKPCYSSVY
jgi:hypothetical protein